MRDLLTIMAYNSKSLVRLGDDTNDDVIEERGDRFPYLRIPRKALINTNDPELDALGKLRSKMHKIELFRTHCDQI